MAAVHTSVEFIGALEASGWAVPESLASDMSVTAAVGAGPSEAYPAADSYTTNRWNPRWLIRENGDGEIEFEPLALKATASNRRQSELLYREGIRRQKIAAAAEWKSIWSQCTALEHDRLKRMEELKRVLDEEACLSRNVKREERKAKQDQNWRLLDYLEGKLRELAPDADAARQLLLSFSNREIHFWKELLSVRRQQHIASGWKLKAQRQIACGLYGRQWSSDCGRQFFTRFHCRNRYCPTCGPLHHDELFNKYMGLAAFVDQYVSEHLGYALRILDLTTVKRGEHMPGPDDVKRFKADVKRLIQRVHRHLGVKIGYLYCLEFGFENQNLHCHGLLLSPYIEQELLSDWWREIRGDGSFKVWIALATSYREGLAHALEYTGKYAASTPERAVELEIAFHGCRRVDTLGLFFKHLPNENEEPVDLRCPCGTDGCFLHERKDLGWQPIEYFERRGIRELEVVRDQCRGPDVVGVGDGKGRP